MNSNVATKKPFLIYLIGQTVSSLGDGLYLVAFVWLSLQLSDGKGIALGGIFSIYTFGELISGLISGPIVDRVDKKKMLIYIDLIRGSILGFLYVLLYLETMTLVCLYICTFLFSIFSPFFYRTEFAILPQIVNKKDLIQANGLLFGLKRLMKVLSPMVGGLLVQLVGMKICFLCDAFSFLFSSVCISFIVINTESKNTGGIEPRNLVNDLRSGYRIILNSSFLLTIAIYAACINFIGAPIFPLLPIISSRIRDGAYGYGVLMSALSMGLIFSSLSIAFFCRLLRRIHIMLCGLIVCSAAIIAMAYGRTFYMTIISCFAMGIGLSLANMPIHTMLQEKLPSNKIGVVSGFVFTTAQIAMPISMALSGFMTHLFTIKTIFVFSGSLMLVGATLGFFLPQFKDGRDTLNPTILISKEGG